MCCAPTRWVEKSVQVHEFGASTRQYLGLLVPETRRITVEVLLRRLFRTAIVSAPVKGHDA